MTEKYEHKAGRASAFANNKKDATNNQPDFKGAGKDLAGNDIWISVYKNFKDGVERLDIITEPKQAGTKPE